jgi:hypothetical protein
MNWNGSQIHYPLLLVRPLQQERDHRGGRKMRYRSQRKEESESFIYRAKKRTGEFSYYRREIGRASNPDLHSFEIKE